jgi:hypothetical protein
MNLTTSQSTHNPRDIRACADQSLGSVILQEPIPKGVGSFGGEVKSSVFHCLVGESQIPFGDRIDANARLHQVGERQNLAAPDHERSLRLGSS